MFILYCMRSKHVKLSSLILSCVSLNCCHARVIKLNLNGNASNASIQLLKMLFDKMIPIRWQKNNLNKKITNMFADAADVSA